MTTTDSSVETAGRGGVAGIFLAFGLFGGFVVVAGLVLALIEGSLAAEHPWPAPAVLVRDLGALKSAGIIELGLALLLLLPIVRNLAIVTVLVRRRQRQAALLALAGMLAMVALYVLLTLRGPAPPGT